MLTYYLQHRAFVVEIRGLVKNNLTSYKKNWLQLVKNPLWLISWRIEIFLWEKGLNYFLKFK